MTKENKEEKKDTKFLEDFKKLSAKHKRDFGIVYEFTPEAGLQAKFKIVRIIDEPAS